MSREGRFAGILVFEEEGILAGRNAEGRPLFRWNPFSGLFAVFRSSRMTDVEREFCLLMLQKYGGEESDDCVQETVDFLSYRTPMDTHCS